MEDNTMALDKEKPDSAPPPDDPDDTEIEEQWVDIGENGAA